MTLSVCVAVGFCVCAQSLSVDSIPEVFFPQDLPLVVEEDPKSAWPGPLSATCSLRTFSVTAAGISEVPSLRKTVKWPSAWADCTRAVTGRGGWLEEDEVKAAPTVAVLDPIVAVRDRRRCAVVRLCNCGSVWWWWWWWW
jgi:hypothetical protein